MMKQLRIAVLMATAIMIVVALLAHRFFRDRKPSTPERAAVGAPAEGGAAQVPAESPSQNRVLPSVTDASKPSPGSKTRSIAAAQDASEKAVVGRQTKGVGAPGSRQGKYAVGTKARASGPEQVARPVPPRAAVPATDRESPPAGILVRDALTGEPVAGAGVALHREQLWPVVERLIAPTTHSPPAEEGKTSAEGVFLPSDPATECWIEVKSPDHALVHLGPLKTKPGIAIWLQRREELETAGVQVTVVGSEGLPIPGALVQALLPPMETDGRSDEGKPRIVGELGTDFRGQCRFGNLGRGSYQFQAPGLGLAYECPWMDVVEGWELKLGLGQFPRESGIAIRILDAAGRPLPGFRVAIKLRERSAWKGGWLDQWNLNRETDFDGSVRFGGLFAGTYDVELGPDRPWKVPGFRKHEDLVPEAGFYQPAVPEVIELKDGEDLSFQWTITAAVIQGRVESPPGRHAGKGTVHASGTGSCAVGTDEEGRFEFRGAPAGRYVLFARDFGRFQSEAVAVIVPERGGPPPITIPLQVDGILKVFAEDSNGLPVPGCRVAWMAPDGPEFFSKQFSGARRLEFEAKSLPAGRRMLFAEAPGWQRVEKTILVEPGAHPDVIFTFK